MRGFEFRVSPPSLSLSLSQLEFWFADCRLSSSDHTPLLRNLYFISFFPSDRIRWVFFIFYREDHGLAEKLLLIFFIFDKFHRHFTMC